ncbi:hypothetical protein C8J57DRAFT_1260643 [Mycena rebaudengoi]|nr:hypothetical protein C8J57DRAFT_1260643 [Mycena rebaudengoi]
MTSVQTFTFALWTLPEAVINVHDGSGIQVSRLCPGARRSTQLYLSLCPGSVANTPSSNVYRAPSSTESSLTTNSLALFDIINVHDGSGVQALSLCPGSIANTSSSNVYHAPSSTESSLTTDSLALFDIINSTSIISSTFKLLSRLSCKQGNHTPETMGYRQSSGGGGGA